jgi:hypothetical protein
MQTTRLGLDFCPICKGKLDAASGKDGTTPKPGDCSMCFYCGAPLILTKI